MNQQQPEPSQTVWHTLAPEEAMARLSATAHGLGAQEVIRPGKRALLHASCCSFITC